MSATAVSEPSMIGDRVDFDRFKMLRGNRTRIARSSRGASGDRESGWVANGEAKGENLLWNPTW